MSCLRFWLKVALAATAAVALLASCRTVDRGLLERLDDATLRDFRDVFERVGTDVADDAGDASFVRQSVPVVLGRKVRGYDELQLFVGLVQATDRARFLRMLTNSSSPYYTEYIEHWSNFFVDKLRVHRETERDLKGCFTPLRSGTPNSNLAACIASNAPGVSCRGSGTAASDFSMGDVLRSAIAADNLEPAYRAYLFPMVNTPSDGADATPLNRRDSVGETFAHVFLHRNLGCLGCHTTPHSVSGEIDINNQPSFWNRHHPVPGAFELAIYGANSGRDHHEVHAPFRPPRDLGGAGSQQPWQMQRCGSFPARTAIPTDTAVNLNGTTFDAFLTRNLGRQSSVWDVEDTMRTGTGLLRTFGLRRNRLLASVAPSCTDHCVGVTSPPATPAPPAAVRTLIAGCAAGCHGAGNGTGLELHDVAPTPPSDWLARVVSEPAHSGRCAAFPYLVVPGQPAQSCLNHLVATDQMPPGGATQQQKDDVRNWIASLPAGAGCDVGEPSVCTPAANDNPAAFAYLTAMNIVDQVWEEAMGNPLTIANYFPRNPFSRDILQNLTETVFLPSGWSLRELLVKTLTSDQFNRRAADTTILGSAYVQQPIAKPFEVNDPRYPPESPPGWTPGSPQPLPDLLHLIRHMRDEDGRSRHRNAVGDSVYRYSTHNLLRSTHRALGWPNVNHVNGGGSYPSDSLRKAMGQFFQDAEPGFRGVGFQALLRWEQEHGLCANKNGAGRDWISEVLARLQSQRGGVSYSRGDMAVLLRDWLIADGTLAATVPVGQASDERALLAAVYGDLAQPVDVSTPAARATLGGQMRAHCGALLMSPQFLLAGIAPETVGPKPALRVCLPGEPCSFREICLSMEGAVRGTLGAGRFLFPRPGIDLLNYTCTDTAVTVEVRTLELPEVEDWACPKHICTAIPGGPQIKECLRDVQACMPRQLPGCRPGCAAIDCCGGPLPPIDKPHFNVVWLERAVIERANGVTVHRLTGRGDKRSALTPEAGMRLQTGDWLEVKPGAELRIVGAGSVLQTPKAGATRRAAGPVFLQISGPEALKSREPDQLVAPVPKASIRQATLLPTAPTHEQRERVRLQPGRTAPRPELAEPGVPRDAPK